MLGDVLDQQQPRPLRAPGGERCVREASHTIAKTPFKPMRSIAAAEPSAPFAVTDLSEYASSVGIGCDPSSAARSSPLRIARHLRVCAQVRRYQRVARLRHEVAIMAAPREHLMGQGGVVTINSGGALLDVWPTGGAGSSRASRLEAEVRRTGGMNLDSAERLDLVMTDVHAARGGWRGRVD